MDLSWISAACDVIILVGALFIAFDRIGKPFIKLKKKTDTTFEEKVADAITRAMPDILKKHDEEMKEEFIMLSLRTKNGIDLEAYKQEFNENLAAKKKSTIANLIKLGFLILTNDNHLICTNKGFLVLNKLVVELIDGDDALN